MLSAEQQPDGFAHRIRDEPDESDEGEDREAGERLVRLHDEHCDEGGDHEGRGREGSSGHRPSGEPDEEHGTEHDDS